MLLRNLPLKAAAFCLAVFLWFWVLLNERNPIVELPVRTEIAAEAVKEGLALQGPLPTAEIRVRGLKREMEGRTGRWVEAYVSCKGLDSGRHRLAVRTRGPENVSVVSVEPGELAVILEPVVTEAKPVDFRLTGEPPAGYELLGATVSPELVRVAGARSRVDRVARVVATMDLSSAVPDVSVSLPVRALDSAGREAAGVTLNPPRVNARVTMKTLVASRTVPVVVRTSGRLAANLKIVSVQVEPPMVTIVGPAGRMREVEQVETVELALGGITSTLVRALPLVVPEDVNLLGDPSVRVRVEVKKEVPVAEPTGQEPTAD
jgi:YbbR domain-containing protein